VSASSPPSASDPVAAWNAAKPVDERRRAGVRWALAVALALAASAASAPVAFAAPPTSASAAVRLEVESGLEHFQARRFAEARAAFLRALPDVPPGEARDNLAFDVAVCDYELGEYRAAEERFARLAEAASPARDEALLHAGWAALARDDAGAAAGYLEKVSRETAFDNERRELAAAIDATRAEGEVAAFDRALAAATAAYDRSDLTAAEAGVREARKYEARASERSRAALDYLAGLVAHERGDGAAARKALEQSLSRNPEDGAARAVLGELALERGDVDGAERHYRESLGADLSPAEASVVREALDALYPLPRPGLGAWLAVGAGYDSNATQSGSTETVGYAVPEGRPSPFTAPAWGVEYRFKSSERTRTVPYYAGDWLLLGNADVQDASLSSHEAGVRFQLAPNASSELRLTAGGGATFSGVELSPFSLDAVLRARFSVSHGRFLQSALGAEARPSLGLSGLDYLTGTRLDVSLGERFDAGRWGIGAAVGYRYNGIGTQLVSVDPLRYTLCNRLCAGARFELPLGYSGPFAQLDADVDVTARLSLVGFARYERRAYLEQNRIDGPLLPDRLRALSEKTRVDDRLTLGARARQRFGAAPELGLFLDYTLRLSGSNVAYARDLDHAFDYDDRNFTQHIVEVGADARF
jgi:tetratricopeptide (TPR) repeat protein